MSASTPLLSGIASRLRRFLVWGPMVSVLLAPGAALAQAPVAAARRLPPALEALGAVGPVDLLPMASASMADPAVLAGAVLEAQSAGARARVAAFDQAVADGTLERVSIHQPGGSSSASAVETWAQHIDGVRVVGASVRRVVADGVIVDLRGAIAPIGRATPSWPVGSSAEQVVPVLEEALGVRLFPERDPAGRPTRLWVPGFDVEELRPAYVFLSDDHRFIVGDAETGALIADEPSIFEAGAGQGQPLPSGRQTDLFVELRGVDPAPGRAVAAGPSLRGDPLLLHLFDGQRVGVGSDVRLLDILDSSGGFQATFDARQVHPYDVPARCAFAAMFFAPVESPGAYTAEFPARLAHVGSIPSTGFRSRDLEDITASEAHGGMSYARRYYQDLVGWWGIDNQGSPTPVIVNVFPYGGEFDVQCGWVYPFRSNAFFAYSGGPWGQGAFGLGTWLSNARSLASAIDVIGHEFVHAMALHGRVNVFGTALGYSPLRVFVRLHASPGRVTLHGQVVACGQHVHRDVVRHALSAALGRQVQGLGIPLYPYCTRDEFPLRMFFGTVPDASEGVPDIGGVGVEFSLASHGALEPDYAMGEDLDGFGIRNLGSGLGGYRHMTQLRQELVVSRYPDFPCFGLVDFLTLYLVPPDTAIGLCALSPVGMSGDQSGGLDIRGSGTPHPIGVILGHAFYLALEGGTGPGTLGTIRGAGRHRLHDLVRAAMAVTAYTQPESLTLPDMAWAILGRIDQEFGPRDPLWEAFASAAIATGILVR